MPLYAYKCDTCGTKHTEIRTIANRNNPGPCKLCTGAIVRDIGAEWVASTNKEWDKPVYSNSLGVARKQVAAHRKKHPSIPITDDGKVIITSLAEQKRINRELGYCDRNRYF